VNNLITNRGTLNTSGLLTVGASPMPDDQRQLRFQHRPGTITNTGVITLAGGHRANHQQRRRHRAGGGVTTP
jgi:hypothetical protein